MTDLNISQNEADDLIQAEKYLMVNSLHNFPDFGGKLLFELQSVDEKEQFFINFAKNEINLLKRNHNLRARRVIGLLRLDLFGPPHRNPDDTEIGGNHLHIYRE